MPETVNPLEKVHHDVYKTDIPTHLKMLQEWKALSWPAIAAFVATLFFFFGYIADAGRTAALATYSLDKSIITQRYAILGAITLASFSLQTILVVALGAAVLKLGRLVIRRLPGQVPVRISGILTWNGWKWVVLSSSALLCTAGLVLTFDMLSDADGLILKPAKELGIAWLRMSLDTDGDWIFGYQLFFVALISGFVARSWWLLTRFAMGRVAKALYSAWAILQVLNLVTAFALLSGVWSTFQPYPVVAFSNMEQVCGKGALPVLIGSDDKVYALLVLFKPEGSSTFSKTVLYLPRSEVKWMALLREEPLQRLARYPELLAPSKPVPAP